MMAERKKSNTLSFNKSYIQPFLTWKGTNTTRDPLRKAHEVRAQLYFSAAAATARHIVPLQPRLSLLPSPGRHLRVDCADGRHCAAVPRCRRRRCSADPVSCRRPRSRPPGSWGPM